jgi:uncharacterized protein YndB with AHSA1/START domain
MAETQQMLRLTRLLNATPEEVFDAWTDPASLSAWFFPGPIELEEVICEPRVGGLLRIVMRGESGLFPHDGEFVAVERPHRLAFTWRSPATGDVDTLVTIELAAQGKRTALTLTHERLPDREAMAKHEGGWTSVLDSLADHLIG